MLSRLTLLILITWIHFSKFYSLHADEFLELEEVTQQDENSNSHLHPFDPLSPQEILQAKQIIERTKPNSTFIYNWITLQEPPKSDLLEYFLTNVDPPRKAYQRKVFVIVFERGTADVKEILVNLDTRVVESFTSVPRENEPTHTPDDDNFAVAIAKADYTVKERCRKLGYPHMDLIYVVSGPLGYVGDRPEYLSLRRGYVMYFYGRNFKNDNPYAHPLDFMAVVDIIQERVIAIEELPTHDDFNAGNKEGNVVPREPANYDYRLKPTNFLRKTDKPIKVSSPKGPSYIVRGNGIEWQNFKMRIGFNAREGLVLYNIVYNDKGNIRPILYRASIAEAGVNYGDPRPPSHRKLGFDEGQYGSGFRTNSLKDQEQCIGETRFFDGVVNNNQGEPRTIKNAICITEEDAGILWQHFDSETSELVVVRSHRLSISFIVVAGNYNLHFRWLFYQDASIQFQTQLTGILLTNMLALNATPAGYGTTVFPQVDGIYHQHYFSLRLDTEIDGNKNSVHMSDIVLVDEDTGSEGNPYGNGVTTRNTPLRTAEEARTHLSPHTGRTWIMTNPNKIHPYTRSPIGWKLMPAVSTRLLFKRDSPVLPKVAFMKYEIWATRYQENQFFPGGLYLNNSGLPEWVENDPDASLENTDIVLWHMLRFAHVPRVEDFPVMPVEEMSVWLKPYNFFLANPALDVPPTSIMHSKSEL